MSTINNQNKSGTTAKKKKAGGHRPGAGRPKGSLNKIQGGEFLAKYKRITGKDFAQSIVEDLVSARNTGDTELLFKYQNALLKYVFSDTASQDITSNGQTINANYLFKQEQLPDWTSVDKQVKVDK